MVSCNWPPNFLLLKRINRLFTSILLCHCTLSSKKIPLLHKRF
jgi:hypothetical protein